MRKIDINIHNFFEQFQKEYDFLYENGNRVAGYAEALAAGDEFISRNQDFVGEFVRYRGDFLSSDREIAAFAFALSHFNAI